MSIEMVILSIMSVVVFVLSGIHMIIGKDSKAVLFALYGIIFLLIIVVKSM